jgi:hypothetical protein
MREYDPIDRNPELMISEPPLRERESGLTTLGILAALAVAVGAGMYFFSTGDNDRVATNDTPPATTGQSTTTPTPPDAGKTDRQ